MKRIFTGYESSGKSLKLADTAADLVVRNGKWIKMGLPPRPIVSNMSFTPPFEEWAQELGVPLIYWRSLEEIKHRVECDIICDELGKFFDSRFWDKLSLEIRTWLSESAKQGVHWYGGAQDFAQVDKSFRRLVQPGDLIQVTKIMGSRRPTATTPPVKRIWGLLMLQQLNPQGYNEDKKQFDTDSWLPEFMTIRRATCEIFYTNKKIEVESNVVLRHVRALCERKDCDFHKLMHV